MQMEAGPANLRHNEPPGWITLDIWALDNLISVEILFSNAFLNLVFCLVANNKSWVKLFSLNILIFILKVTPVWFLAADFVLSVPPTTSSNTVCWIALGSVSKAFYLLKSTAISL